MAGAPVVITAKKVTALARIERQENNLARIKEAKTQFYRDQVVEIDLTPTPPKRKPAFNFTEDHKPYLKVGEFVKVEAKTDTGFNRIEGYGYIEETFGVEIAA